MPIGYMCVSAKKNNKRALHSCERHYESMANKYDLVFLHMPLYTRFR